MGIKVTKYWHTSPDMMIFIFVFLVIQWFFCLQIRFIWYHFTIHFSSTSQKYLTWVMSISGTWKFASFFWRDRERATTFFFFQICWFSSSNYLSTISVQHQNRAQLINVSGILIDGKRRINVKLSAKGIEWNHSW